MILRSLFILSIFVPFCAVAGEEDKAKDLPLVHDFFEALKYTYEGNPTLVENLAKQEVTAEAVPEALSGWRPELSVTNTITSTRTKTRPKPETILGDKINAKRDVVNATQATASYNIFEGGKTVYSTAQAKATVRAGFGEFYSEEQKSLFAGAQAYFEILKAHAQVRVNQSQEKRLKEQLRLIQAEADVGEKSLTDVAQARVDYIAAVDRRIIAERDLEVRKAAFTQITRSTPNVEGMKLPELPTDLFPQSLEEATRTALGRHPILRNAKHRLEASEKGVGVARSSFLPKVDLQASSTLNRNKSNVETSTSSNNDNKQYVQQALVRVTVPIYQKGAEWSGLRKSVKSKAQARRQLERARTEIVREVAEAWNQWKYLKQQLEQLKVRVEAAKLRLEGRRQEFQAGEIRLLDVTVAEDQYIQAEVAKINAEQDERIQACRLLASMGRFHANDLKLDVKQHNVERYYNKVRGKWIGGLGE